jgi:HNH endonuclease
VIDVERSTLAPASLARKTSWSDQDVLEALHRDFYGKCYLCERKLAIGEIQVEHRRPRSHWPEGTHHWPNLFPACAFCNGRRSKSHPEVGLLSPGDGIERRIVQLARVDRSGTAIECEFMAFDPKDLVAQATAEELERLHSGHGARSPRARYATRGLRDMIHDHFLDEVHPLVLKVRRARSRRQPDAFAEAALATVISRRAPFTMLVRSLVHRSLEGLFD